MPTRGIPYPTGDPDVTPEEEQQLRRQLLERALEALGTAVEGPTVFELHATSAAAETPAS